MKVILSIFTASLIAFGLYYYRDAIMKTMPEPNYQDYDMYVFALQWGNNYCVGKNLENKTCKELLEAIPKNKVSIHGLWPSLQSGKYMEDCNQSGEDIDIVDDGSALFTKMKSYWCTLEPKNTNEYFWGHEYNKHGYCYSEYIGDYDYDYKKYFAKAFEVFENNNYEDIVINAFGDKSTGEYGFNYDEVLERLDSYFGGRKYSLTCKSYSGKYYLSEIRVLLGLDFVPFAGKSSNSCKKGAKVYLVYK